MLRHGSLGAPVALVVLALAIAFVLGGVGLAEAQCAIGTPVGGECVISTEETVSGTLNFTLPVHITSTGLVQAANQSGFTLNVNAGTGNVFVMDSGAEVSGDLTHGSCSAGQMAAPVTIQANGGNVLISHGASVHSNSNCPAGWVQILTSGAGTIDVHGLVESVSTASGAGTGRPGGGPISIVGGCELTIHNTGVVSSRGKDPGADLVHLEGCRVEVFGLVESTGTGHGAIVDNPPTSCGTVAPRAGSPPRRNPATRSGKPDESVACVEIWSGTEVVIDSMGTNRGEVHADVSFSGGSDGRGWVEIVARGNISILDGTGNDTPNPNDPDPAIPPAIAFTPPIAAIHANAGFPVDNATAGLVDIISIAGGILGRGFVIEASTGPNSNNGTGGILNLRSALTIDLDTALLEAIGDIVGNATTGVNFGTGGQMTFRAFNGNLTWQNGEGDVRPTGSIIPVAQRGEIEFLNCNTGTVNITGTVFPFIGAAPTTPTTTALGVACGGAPALPPYVVLPAANCLDVCQVNNGCKRGVKFRDLEPNSTKDVTDPLLANWRIVAFNAGGTEVGNDLTDAQGAWEICLPPGTYTFCEVLQANWTQTFPVLPNADPTIVSCVGLTSAFGTLGAVGYRETLTSNGLLLGNDFGNFLDEGPGGECPEDPRAVPTKTVDTSKPVSASNFHTVQAAYDAAAAANGEIIGIFSNTVENIVLGGAKTLKITQCTLAQVTAASPGLPVWDISSTGILTIIGPDSVGGTVGWNIQSDGHTVSGVRAAGASECGIKLTSTASGNTVSFNTVETSAVGVCIDGDGNDVRGGTVLNNTGDGVAIGASANGNTFRTATVRNNGGNGIAVAGTSNIVRDNKVARDNNTGNFLNGILVTGTGTTLQNNETNDNGQAGIRVGPAATGTVLKGNKSNRGAAGGVKENTGPEYQLEVAVSAPTQNQADNVNIPQSKCGFFPGIGTCE